jgi:hypothetical protein
MNGSNSKPKEGAPKLVRILPVETQTDPKDKTGQRILMQRHWQADKMGRFFAANLSPTQLKPALVKARVKLEKLSLKEDGDCLVYQYKGRPLIMLNRKDGLFYSLPSELTQFGQAAVEHQAHIVLELLKQNGLSNATAGRAVQMSSDRAVLSQLRSYQKD